MIICNMGKYGRVNEFESYKKVFIENNILIFGEIKVLGIVEGGDVIWLDEKLLVVGYLYRINFEGIV